MQQYARGAVVWRKRRKAWSLAIVAHGVAPHRSTSESDVDDASFTVSCAFLTGYPTPPPAVAHATRCPAEPRAINRVGFSGSQPLCLRNWHAAADGPGETHLPIVRQGTTSSHPRQTPELRQNCRDLGRRARTRTANPW